MSDEKSDNNNLEAAPATGGPGATPASQRSGGANGIEPTSPGAKSCLSGSGKNPARPRTDSNGCSIEKGHKKHKIVFIDQVQQGASVHEVREVRAFKNKSGGCNCSLM